MKTIALLLGIALAGSVSGQLTEESIRKLLSQRDELIRQRKSEEISRLYTSNVTIRIAATGHEDEINVDEYFSSFSDKAEDTKWQSYTASLKKIEIAAAGQSARIENTIQCTVLVEKNDDQVITFYQDEFLTVTNIDRAPKISSARIVYTYHPVTNELYTRAMTRLEEKGEIDTETAIAWLEEAGCTYQEGDGKRRKTTISAQNSLNSGDEVAVLAAQIPGAQVLWLNFISDDGLGYVSQINNLESLMALNSELTDNGVAKLAACTNLNALFLHNSQLSDKALKHIADFPNLERLQISSGPNAAQGLAHLTHAAKLNDLMIYNVPAKCIPLLKNIPTSNDW
ncbi:hypothetical protein P4B35_10280 [Pontiellaceae bacterium B12227]|nr:hypothetical protein [Pontiellaceae bacterium B12227]